MKNEVTRQTKAWLTQHCYTPLDKVMEGNINDVSFSTSDMKSAGWTFIGDALITINFIDKNELIKNKVEALKEEAKSIRAESAMKCTEIDGKIQNLLAISFDESSRK